MTPPYQIGTKIDFTAMNQSGKRLECVAEFTKMVDGQPEFRVVSPAGVFKNPPTLQFIQDFIISDSQGLRYKGEIGGAVLIPDFLWS
jgi:hypothetical protein